MYVGAHESIAGGLYHAFSRGEQDGCETIQIWTGYNTRWEQRVLLDEEASCFRSEAARLPWPILSHCSYLINIARPEGALRDRALKALEEELIRCETLRIPYTVLHPGSHKGEGELLGLKKIAQSLSELHRRTRGFNVELLLEITAGQGHCLGHRLDHFKQIFEQTWEGERLGICFDTCHAFAAGFDIASDDGYLQTMNAVDKTLGLERIKAFHLNDSMHPLGSHKDRHQHIGEGEIGLKAFERLVNDPRFNSIPGILETPMEEDGTPSFARNIRTLKGLRQRKSNECS